MTLIFTLQTSPCSFPVSLEVNGEAHSTGQCCSSYDACCRSVPCSFAFYSASYSVFPYSLCLPC